MLTGRKKLLLFKLLYECNLALLLILSPILINNSNIIFNSSGIQNQSSKACLNPPTPTTTEINTRCDQTTRFDGLKTQKTGFNVFSTFSANNSSIYPATYEYYNTLLKSYLTHNKSSGEKYLLSDLPPPLKTA